MKRHGRHIPVASKERRTGLRDIVYDSLLEKEFAGFLDLMCRHDGTDWEHHPKVDLGGITYKPDFVELRDGKEVVQYYEVKAHKALRGSKGTRFIPIDAGWAQRKKQWQLHGPADLEVWTKHRGQFICVDVIMKVTRK